MRNRRLWCFLGLAAMAATAHASSCEQNFQAIGDPRNGLTFTGAVSVPGLSVSSALGQMRNFANEEGAEAGADSFNGDRGEVLFTRSKGLKRPIVYHVRANASGLVSLSTKLAPGQQMDAGIVRTSFCNALNALKAGKEGEAIAAAARAASSSDSAFDEVIEGKARDLSRKIQRDVAKSMAAVNSKGRLGNLLVGSRNYATENERANAMAPVIAKYKGRRYRIDGQIYTITENEFTRVKEIAYLVAEPEGLFRGVGGSTINNHNFTIRCDMAPDQVRLFYSLSEKDWIKLEGTVDQISETGMKLKDCRQAT